MKRFSKILGIVCVAALAVSLSSCNGKKETTSAAIGGTVRMATKPLTEQLILGEMVKQLLESTTNLKVELTAGVGGGTTNIQPAMEKGEFDFYPEYTGTGWNMVLKNGGKYAETSFSQMQSEYAERYGFEWLDKIGFNNTYGIAVLKSTAEKYNLKTYSDLALASKDLRFGANYDWFERVDGFKAVQAEYGFDFKELVDLDIGLRFPALLQGEIDVLSVFTTDGQLANPEIVVLEDDKNFYPSYICAFVVRKEAIEKYPELKNALLKLSGKIDDAKMSRMNRAVEIDGLEPADVAKEFLEETGLAR